MPDRSALACLARSLHLALETNGSQPHLRRYSSPAATLRLPADFVEADGVFEALEHRLAAVRVDVALARQQVARRLRDAPSPPITAMNMAKPRYGRPSARTSEERGQGESQAGPCGRQ
jgi:hypothetical protein